MKKAQKRTRKAIAVILDATGLTQKEFAEMTGASLDTVKAWARKRNPSPISAQFESRILAATGAKINADGSVVSFERSGGGKPFTLATFKYWRAHETQSNEVAADHFAYVCANDIRRIFHAAIQPVRGKRNGTLAVFNSFCDWLEDTRNKFNLNRQLEAMGRDYFRVELDFIVPEIEDTKPSERTRITTKRSL
jgi:transposase